MLWVGYRPDVYTFTCVLRTYGGIPDWKIGREIHVHVIRLGFGCNIDVLNAMITMYMKCGDIVSARKQFDGMAKVEYGDDVSDSILLHCWEFGRSPKSFLED
nr:pentatricopeptide repeat-containing protein At1g15510, chloroplastic [Ipomoea batatas]GMC77662.1 pentatricopeptide repeat-containing protein At1g15510, chloroplastic [Ipomoea batatas]